MKFAVSRKPCAINYHLWSNWFAGLREYLHNTCTLFFFIFVNRHMASGLSLKQKKILQMKNHLTMYQKHMTVANMSESEIKKLFLYYILILRHISTNKNVLECTVARQFEIFNNKNWNEDVVVLQRNLNRE